MAWNHDQRKQAAAAAKAKAAVEAQQNAEFNVRVYCVAKRLETSVTLTRGLVSTEVLEPAPNTQAFLASDLCHSLTYYYVPPAPL